MSEKDTTTTTVTADVPATEPTPTPDGMIRLQDVLDVIRKTADDEGWCDDGERYTRSAFADAGVSPLQFVEAPYDPDYCCKEHSPDSPTAKHLRFQRTGETPEFITPAQLHQAMRAAGRRRDQSELYTELREKFLADHAPASPRRWTVTFTVTENEDIQFAGGQTEPTAYNMLRATVRDYMDPQDFTATEITAPAKKAADETATA